MQKILGLDLGTNSIGWAIRNTALAPNQIEKAGVITFEKGVGTGKTGEYSFAAERTKNRSLRRRYQSHKYKLWATLEVLITHGYCPLTLEGLDRWRKYEKGVGRVYPVDDAAFASWIKLDFNGDGRPDYSSPYQLRLQLVSEPLDLGIPECRHKLGRALYHIAQHRGFKSSKKVQEAEEYTNEADLVGAEEKRAQFVEALMQKHDVPTVGAAFALEERAGQRIRKELHQHVLRKQLQSEVKQIFAFQGLDFQALFGKEVGKSPLFWQRPLRSQKGAVGRCTLEPGKNRCPVSHPDFEEFRAWSFLNTIQYRAKGTDQTRWQKLPLELRQELYREKFFRVSQADFDFVDIRKAIEKKNGHTAWELNYSDKTNVSGCPVSARLQQLLGEEWRSYQRPHALHPRRKAQKSHYDLEDIWHVLFSFDDEDAVRSFAQSKLELGGAAEKFVALWYHLPVGYGMLSLHAISKILPFLRQGFIYSEAVLLAKMPELFGEGFWQENKERIIGYIAQIIDLNREAKKRLTIVNGLIANYKAQEPRLKFAERNFEYRLQEDDVREVERACTEGYGVHTWSGKSRDEQEQIILEVQQSYQSFFSDTTRAFKKLPHLLDTVKAILADTFDLDANKLSQLYHPSQIEIYPPAKEQFYEAYNMNLRLLCSPKTGAFKNPMAMRTLHELRKLVNYLLVTEQIDDDTRIVVEVARELNDANMRWAIKTYQERKQQENKEFRQAIGELLGGVPVSDAMVDKYRLWQEQQGQCLYTGRMIGVADLFAGNNTDFEHTLPRSLSFDNSLANQTVCDFVYNRMVKKKRMPAELPNYEQDVVIGNAVYTAIKPRLQAWEQKVQDLQDNVAFWRKKARQAITKEAKDKAIRQKHLWQLELTYWRNKVGRFTMSEVSSGFKNSQLVDTQIITKYAFHYLKTAFDRVEVQKGAVTSEFRKIYGVQPQASAKDRSRHSHHAKDAAVLTLIPLAAKREEILKKAYVYSETYNQQYTEPPYPGFRSAYIDQIDNAILVNNIRKDQALTPARRKVRMNGKEQWATGDTIRGQLHLDTFYGKIRLVERDANGKPLRSESGEWQYAAKNDGFAFVIRQEVTKDLKVDSIVDPHLKVLFLEQMNGRTLEKTLKEDGAIWMRNKAGAPVHRIRHVRCFAPDVSAPLAIKRQTYLSGKEYKNSYWAKNAENYAYALYQGIVRNKIERDYRLINLLEAAQLRQVCAPGGLEVEREVTINKKGDRLQLYAVLKSGQKVLFFRETPDELNDLPVSELSRRLYYIINFEKDGRIVFGHHLDARSDAELKLLEGQLGKAVRTGFSSIDYVNPHTKLRLSVGNLNFLIEGKDFEVRLDGTICFL